MKRNKIEKQNFHKIERNYRQNGIELQFQNFQKLRTNWQRNGFKPQIIAIVLTERQLPYYFEFPSRILSNACDKSEHREQSGAAHYNSSPMSDLFDMTNFSLLSFLLRSLSQINRPLNTLKISKNVSLSLSMQSGASSSSDADVGFLWCYS